MLHFYYTLFFSVLHCFFQVYIQNDADEMPAS